MASLIAGDAGLDMFTFNPFLATLFVQYTVTPTEIRLIEDADNYTSVTGLNLTVEDETGIVTGGSLRGLKVFLEGEIALKITGLRGPAVDLFDLDLFDVLGMYAVMLRRDDTITGGASADALLGFAGNDIIDGGAGDDYLNGSSGRDTFEGGTGKDWVSFSDLGATQGVVANLATQTISNDGFGNSESMHSIESLGGGTVFADFFAGNSASNFFFADTGDKVVSGGGNDTFAIDGAPALVNGGTGIDTIESFSGETLVPDQDSDGLPDLIFASSGVVINLGAGTISDDGFGNSGALISIENVTGGTFADQLRGGIASNKLDGGAGADTLSGAGGSDTLNGGEDHDLLQGDVGGDKFVFDAPVKALNSDIITDFGLGADQICLDNSVFKTLGAPGSLSSAAFFVGAEAHDSDDRVLYDPANGALYYDKDGVGGGAKVLIATLSNHPDLGSDDIRVI